MLVEVVRPYSGLEGKRVKPGTRFSVDKERPGLQMITIHRANALKRNHLIKEIAIEGETPMELEAPRPAKNQNRPRRPVAKVEEDSAPGPSRERDAQRRRTSSKAPRRQDPEPAAPRKLSGPAGSLTGQDALSSASPAARPITSSTLRQRGTRRDKASGGSQSTTHSDSSPGPKSSTPATTPGGEPSPESPDSAAFE